jgi:hypothetical protein
VFAIRYNNRIRVDLQLSRRSGGRCCGARTPTPSFHVLALRQGAVLGADRVLQSALTWFTQISDKAREGPAEREWMTMIR